MRNPKDVAIKAGFALLLVGFMLSLFCMQFYIVKEQTQMAQLALQNFGPSAGFHFAVNCREGSYCVSGSTIKTRIKVWNDITYPDTLASMRVLMKDYSEQESYERGVNCTEGLAAEVCQKGSKFNRMKAWKEIKG